MRRTVRSYVLRQGRVTAAQQRALAELMPVYGIEFKDELLRPSIVFGRCAPLVLEIGSGMGETTAHIARERPGTDFIAVEVHSPGVGSLLKLVDKVQLKNMRVVRHDALEVLEKMIPDGALAGIHLFFPDPWPKKRHHKRRLVQPAFAALAARKLAPEVFSTRQRIAKTMLRRWRRSSRWSPACAGRTTPLRALQPSLNFAA